MTTFTTRTKTMAGMVASLVALTSAALAHGATTREVSTTESNLVASVVRLGQATGFWATDCPLAVGNAAAWAQGDAAEAAALHSEGFAVGVREPLRSRSGDLGFSLALRFRTASGATADLDRRERLAGREGYATNFAVPGSPSVRAYTVRTAGSTIVRVAFTRGDDEYALAVQAAAGTDIGVLQRALAASVARATARP